MHQTGVALHLHPVIKQRAGKVAAALPPVKKSPGSETERGCWKGAAGFSAALLCSVLH